MVRQTARRQDGRRIRDDSLEDLSARLQGPCPGIAAARVESVEGDRDGRSRGDLGMRFGKEFEPRDELLVEHRHLAIKDERCPRQRRDGLCEIGESGSVVDTFAAHKPDSALRPIGYDAPAVHFLFVDPTRTVKGLDEHRLEGANFEGSKASTTVYSARRVKHVRCAPEPGTSLRRTIAAASVTRAGQGEGPRLRGSSK